MGVNEVGKDEIGSRRSGTIPLLSLNAVVKILSVGDKKKYKSIHYTCLVLFIKISLLSKSEILRFCFTC